MEDKPGGSESTSYSGPHNPGRKPVLSENPTNDELNEALDWGIATLRKHRKTHVEWRDWLRKHPEHPTDDLGDADFHNECVQTYNTLIAIVETVREIPVEVAAS